jgi:hypothetical protein
MILDLPAPFKRPAPLPGREQINKTNKQPTQQ